MLEGFATQLVDKYVAPYANVDPEQLRVGVRDGKVVLRDVRLKPEAFDSLGLPLTIREGVIGELEVDISWKSLRAKPVQIRIKDVSVIVGLTNEEQLPQRKAEQMLKEKFEQLLEDEEVRRMRVHGQATASLPEQSFAIRLFAACVGPIHASIENVHLRYEDATSIAERPFAAGIRLDRFSLVSTNDTWQAVPPAADASTPAKKKLAVEGLALYWQSGCQRWEGFAPDAAAMSKCGAYFVVPPTGAEARLRLSGDGAATQSQARIAVEVSASADMVVRLDCAAVRDVSALVDAAVLNANRQKLPRARPSGAYTGNARAWWGHAIACVLVEVRERRAASSVATVLDVIRLGKRYVPLFRKRLDAEVPDGASSSSSSSSEEEAEAREVRELEEALPLGALLALRGRVEELVEGAREAAKRRSAQTPGSGGAGGRVAGLFARLFKGWRRGEDGVATTEVAGLELAVSEEEVCALCGAADEEAFSDLAGEGSSDPRFSVLLSVPTLRVQVCDKAGHTGPGLTGTDGIISAVEFLGTKVEVVGKPAAVVYQVPRLPFSVDVTVAGISMTDAASPATVLPLVVRSGTSLLPNAPPSVHVRFEVAPPASNACFLLSIQTGATQLSYSAALHARLVSHLEHVNRVDTRALAVLLSRRATAAADQTRLAAQRLVRQAVEYRHPFDFDLDLTLPHVVFPETVVPAAFPDAAVLVCSGGQLVAKSTVQPEQAGDGLYDRCHVTWTGVGARTCQGRDDWANPATGDHVLLVTDAETVIDVSAARNNMAYTQLVIKQSVARVLVVAGSRSVQKLAALEFAYHRAAAARNTHSTAGRALEETEASTLVGWALSGVAVLESGWDVFQRRELAVLDSLPGDRAAQRRAYADWQRVDFSLVVEEISVSIVDEPEKSAAGGEAKGVKLLEVKLLGCTAKALVKSLEASASASLQTLQVEDLVQSFGPDYRLLVGSNKESAPAAEALATVEVVVWHPKSPDRGTLDVEVKAAMSNLYLGGNLETVSVLHDWLFVVLQRASAAPGSGEDQGDELGKSGQAVGREVSRILMKHRALAIHFQGKIQAIEARAYMARDGDLLDISRLTIRDILLTNDETRQGRIAVSGSVGTLAIEDLTPAGANFSQVVSQVEGGGKLAAAEYVHYGRGQEQSPDGLHASLSVTLCAIQVVASPRFVAETLNFVRRSTVFRSNFAAASKLRESTRDAATFRGRLDTNALAYSYRLGIRVAHHGGRILLPESSLSNNWVALVVPPLEFANTFSDGDEGAEGGEGGLPQESMTLGVEKLRVVTCIGGQERDLLSLSVTIDAARSLAADSLPPDSPVVCCHAAVAPILVEISPPQVALAWQMAFANLAEVKAVWSWQYAEPLIGKKRCILDLPRVKAALQRAIRHDLIAERARQAAFSRADAHLLDIHATISFQGLEATLLALPPPSSDAPPASPGGDTSGPLAGSHPLVRLELVQMQAGIKVWSDTAYSVEASLEDMRILDVNPNSANVHTHLLAPAPPIDAAVEEELLLWAMYEESKTASGVLDVRSTGIKVTLVAQPILDVLALIFSSAPPAPPAPSTDAALPPPRALPVPPHGRAASLASGSGMSGMPVAAGDAYSWWGDSTLEARFECGMCHMTVVQDQKKAESARLVVALAFGGEYHATREKEQGKLSVRDLRVFMRIHEVPEPLHLLEKAALSLEVTRTYANGAYSTKTVLASRAVDVVLTYQDMKRCYAIYRAFLREDDRAGFSKSKGVSYLSELLEKDDLAPSRQARARSLSITSQSTTGPTLAVPGTSELQVRLDVATLCLVNDCMGSTAPFATLTLKGASVDVTSHPDQSMAIAASVTLDVAFYNIMSSCFEPIMEPWTLKVTATETEGRAASALKVESLSRVEFNLSEMHLRGAVQTVEGWLQDTKTWGADPDAVNDKFWPYRLRNESGVPIFFWLGSTYEPSDATMCKDIASGGEEPFQFSNKRSLQARQRDMSLEFHTLSIRFEGVEDVLTHVPVDITGVHMLPLGDLRAVAEIHNDAGCKIIAVQSTFKLYNKTSNSLEAAVCDEEGDGQHLWMEEFAGDMHGCVPLQLAQSKYLQVRPAGGKHKLCAKIPVPTSPVTGESLFVRCGPADDAPEGTTSLHLRVRLDAKRPVGGHEENMRIVVSLHPALRIQNALPYPISTSLFAASPTGILGEQLAAAVTEEGAVEQLYCADLTTPLMLSVICKNFRKVREPVLVFAPDGMGGVNVAKTIDLLDDQGVALRLGVEAISSAWGDLTIVVYAHYLVRNFSHLPLTYAVAGGVSRSVISAAGQVPDLDGSVAGSPQLGNTPDAMAHSGGPSFEGLFAGFGPRSSFNARMVRTDPPLADKALVNGAALRGAIAVITRGIVPFTEKARKAAAAGAVAVIFINTDDSTFLAEGDKGPGIRIPCVMLRKCDAAVIDWSLSPEDLTTHVAPEKVNSSQRASSQSMEWKRVVKASIRFGDTNHSSSLGNTPDSRPRMIESLTGGAQADPKDKGGTLFPDSWMEQPCEPPFIFSFASTDLTGNRACFQVNGSPWGPAFSLESVGTNGILEVPGKPADAPELKKACPLYEFGLAFELGMGYLSRSKLVSIVPRYTLLNRLGYTLQISQQGLEDEHAAVLELPDGDLRPFHWVDGKLAKSVRIRVVPQIGTTDTYQTGWSGPLLPDQVGTFSARLPNLQGGIEGSRDVIMEVKVRKAASFIVFRLETSAESALYALENRSSKPIKVWQEGSNHLDLGLKAAPATRAPVTWDRPHAPHILVLAQEGSQELVKVAMDEFGSVPTQAGLKVEVVAERGSRVLRVTDVSLDSDSDIVSMAGEEALPRNAIRVVFAGLCVSVLDAKLEEIMYASLLDFDLEYKVTRTDYEFELKIGKVQVDNQTDKGPEIVLGIENSKGGEDTSPAVHLSIVRARQFRNMQFYKYFALKIRELDLEIDETFVMRILDSAQNVVDSSTITVPDEKFEDVTTSGYKQLRFLGTKPVQGDKMYIEMLELHPIVVNLSFFGTGAIMERTSTDGGGLSYNPMFAAIKALGVVITNIDRAPIALNALMLERPFATNAELMSCIRKHYKTQLVQQLYKLVGSFEFLGNPVGLVSNLGTGMKDFFYEPAQGMMKSPGEFAKGMSKGTSSLLQKSTFGLFNAASKITGSMSKSLVQMSGDDDYIKKRQEAQSARQKKTNVNHTKDRQDLSEQLSDGFMGIFAKPMAGAREGGTAGFFSGLGKGILGAVVKPTAGLMDLTSKAAEGVRNTSRAGEMLRRVRPPRVHLGDQVLRNYDARSAHGCDAMRRLRDGEWKEHRYIGFCVLEDGEAVLVSDKHVCVHAFTNHEEKWAAAVSTVKDISVEGRVVSLSVEVDVVGAAGAKEVVSEAVAKQLTCTDNRYAEYLADVLRRAVALAQAASAGRAGGGRSNNEYML